MQVCAEIAARRGDVSEADELNECAYDIMSKGNPYAFKCDGDYVSAGMCMQRGGMEEALLHFPRCFDNV